MPDYERLWERLLEFLDTWATATEIGPGRIRVDFEKSPGWIRVVHILMTDDEWDDTVTVMWGSFDDAAREVRERILGLQPDERFLLYGQYELVPSATERLPVDPDVERLQQLARQHPEGFGTWVVLDKDGDVLDEFRRAGE
jgi:hypothetical protein